jgi:hypothetical protein
VAPAPPIAVAPTVLALQRFGFDAQPTTLVISSSTALDPARAQDLRNYQLVSLRRHGRLGRLIRLLSSVYDPTMQAVTLPPAERLPLHDSFLLTVNGTAPNGLAGATGTPLEGSGNGHPGSNFVVRFGMNALAGSSDAAFNRVRYQWAGSGPFGGRRARVASRAKRDDSRRAWCSTYLAPSAARRIMSSSCLKSTGLAR